MSYAHPGQPSARWQDWVENKPILSLAIVGVVATQLGTYFGYVFPAFGLPVLPWPLYNGILGTLAVDRQPQSSVDVTPTYDVMPRRCRRAVIRPVDTAGRLGKTSPDDFAWTFVRQSGAPGVEPTNKERTWKRH